jgi:HD-GYP domain-containing protein (c-di-GMP phosphodiesterase class II)
MKGWARSVVVTLVVAVLPVAIVWALWALGIVTSAWVAAALVAVLALLASLGGAAYWKRRPATGDVLFADLLLWGWLRRARAERRMADAVELLRRSGSEDEAEKLRLLGELAEALDAKDPYLDGHSHRVARFSALMTSRLDVPPEEAERIHTAAAIHDVGKLHVSPALLAKPSRLSPAEAEAVQRHAEEGAAMVACLGDPSLSNIVRHHHERFDGGGYPAGLSGEAIPLGARVVAVADTFDAIVSARPYRPAETHKRALDVLVAEAGTQLDPIVVRAFLREYAGRRGLALWALLALPIAKARRHPLPAGLVAAGLVLGSAIASAVLVTGGQGPPRTPQAAAATNRSVVPDTTTHHRARAKRAPAIARAARGPALVAVVAKRAAFTSGGGLQTPAGRQSAPDTGRTAKPRAVTPPTARRTPEPATPRPKKPQPSAPGPAATPLPSPAPTSAQAPAPSAPVVSAPAATRPSASGTTPASPGSTSAPPPATPVAAGNCKKGAWGAASYRNQGQCVSAQHGP